VTANLRPPTLPTTIANELRRQILHHELRPGEQLPGHRELAARFDVSLGSVREAISMLVSAGMLQTRAGRGTYVSDVGDGAGPVHPRVGPPLSQREVEELVEARAVIEVELAALAAERATAEQIEALKAAAEHMEEASASLDRYSDADVRFHLALAEAADNRYLLQAMIDIRALLREDMELSAEAAIRRFGNLRMSVISHRRLAEAIEARDAGAARRIVREIVSRNRTFVLGLYALAEAPDGA
jgi:GntR family transcriptional repressor for pyruvate dehydrogenase complex